MNRRIFYIINQIIMYGEIEIASISKKFNITERMVRYDLDELNHILIVNKLNPLNFSCAGIARGMEDFENIKDIISKNSLYYYKFSKKERVYLISYFLILTDDIVIYQELSDRLFVSRSTITSDIVNTKKFLSEYNISLVSQYSKGIAIEGSEFNKREVLFEVLNYVYSELGEIFEIQRMLNLNSNKKIIIQKLLNQSETEFNNFLTDSSYNQVMLYIDIVISRNLQGHYLKKDIDEFNDDFDNNRYKFSNALLNLISKEFNLDLDKKEIYRLCKFLERVKYIKTKPENRDILKVQLMTRKFIKHISSDLDLNLNNDYELFENLSNHFASILAIEHTLIPENIIVEQIVNDYQEVLRAVKDNLYIFTEKTNKKLNEMEIIYISVHICAAAERNTLRKDNNKNINVAIVCNSGIGTSRFLSARLEKYFNFNVVSILSTHELDSINQDKVDLIISTVILKKIKENQFLETSTVYVSAALNDEDYMKISKRLDEIYQKKNHKSSERNKNSTRITIEQKELYEIIEKYAPLKFEKISKEIKKKIDNSNKKKIGYEINSLKLKDILKEKHILLDINASDWKEAIAKSAEVLYKDGYIEYRYIDSMIENVEKNGPYMLIAKGVALAHSNVDNGTIKLGLSLARLLKPVNFGSKELDPIKYIFTLSAVDNKKHLTAIFNLSNMLMKPKFIQDMDCALSSNELYEVIKRNEMYL